MPYQSTGNQINTKEPTDYELDSTHSDETVKNTEIRKRIDDLLEKKKLKELLDDSDDWDV